MKKYYIGIDLGTTNSAVAVGVINNNGEIEPKVLEIPQVAENGIEIIRQNLLPSAVYFETLDKVYVGAYAKRMKGQAASRTVFNAKRYMGDPNKFYEIDGKVFRPEDISSYILKTIKIATEESLGIEKIDDVVITVPASFNFQQVMATRKAAENAGFKKITTLSEPTAALLDFINEQKKLSEQNRYINFKKDQTLLVFDLGGGTCDISIIKVKENNGKINIKELAISRYTELGGHDFDNAIGTYLLKDFITKNKIPWPSLSIEEKQEVANKFLAQAEKVKTHLSTQIFTILRSVQENDPEKINQKINEIKHKSFIQEVYQGIPYIVEITKPEIDQIIYPLIDENNWKSEKNIFSPIIDALKKAGLEKNDIDYVFLVGGMTEYYTIEQKIQEFFGKKPLKMISPTHSVARGASIYQYYVEVVNYAEEGVGTIVPENIYIETKGKPYLLLARGTEAPYSKILENVFQVSGSDKDLIGKMELKLFLAENEYNIQKGRILNSARLFFNHPVRGGTPFTLKVEFDTNRNVKVTGWIKDNPDNKIEVNLLPEHLS